jgi:hypothetical protein
MLGTERIRLILGELACREIVFRDRIARVELYGLWKRSRLDPGHLSLSWHSGLDWRNWHAGSANVGLVIGGLGYMAIEY